MAIPVSYRFSLDVEFNAFIDGQGDPSESHLWKEFLDVDDIEVTFGKLDLTKHLSESDEEQIAEKAVALASEEGLKGHYSTEFEIELDLDVKKSESGKDRVYYNGVDITEELEENELARIIELANE